MIDSKTAELWQDSAWGSPLHSTENTLVMDKDGKFVPLDDIVKKHAKTVNTFKVVENLERLCDMIEGDITYFRNFEGQSMATNRLAMIKGFIHREIESLKSL